MLEGAKIDNAYLYGELDLPIIMQQPTDSTLQPAKSGFVCGLVKALYGTKQACEIWGSYRNETLKNGFSVHQA